jgi:TetR/AcrR family transcriptional regulator, copper-responsive repressor
MNGMSIQARDGASTEELRILAQTALAALPVEGQNQGASSKE